MEGRGGLRERKEEGELESAKNGGKKGDGLFNKNVRKCKQSELKTGGERKVNEVEASEVVGVVKFSGLRLALRVRIKMSWD